MSRKKFYSHVAVLDDPFDLDEVEQKKLDFRKKTVESYLNEGWSIGGSSGNYYIVPPNLKKKISIWDEFEVEDIFQDIYSEIDKKINLRFNSEFEYEFMRESIWDSFGYRNISDELNIAQGLVKLLRKLPESVRECLVKTYFGFKS
jgi:hypothetical protein